jgi:hypothetical protein
MGLGRVKTLLKVEPLARLADRSTKVLQRLGEALRGVMRAFACAKSGRWGAVEAQAAPIAAIKLCRPTMFITRVRL